MKGAVSAKGAVSVSAEARVEAFEPKAFGALEDHIKSHNFPAHIKTCGPCKFWKNRWKWSAMTTFRNELTRQDESWLAIKNGQAICIVCAAYNGPGTKDSYAIGVGSLLRASNLKRHGNLTWNQKQKLAAKPEPQRGINWTHELALRAWNSRALTANSQGEAVSASRASPIVASKQEGPGYASFLFARALLETRGSFRDFEAWAAAAAAGGTAVQMGNREIGAEHVNTVAAYERLVTQRFLREGALFRLLADGLGRVYQVEIGTVIWKFPSSLRVFQQNVAALPWLEQLGPNGPWIVERLTGAREFPNTMDTASKATMLEDCARRAAVSAAGEVDANLFEHLRKHTRVWTSDGADRDVGLAATQTFPGLCFHAWDESHSAVRLLGNALQDDPEIQVVDQLLVTRKKPQSLAKFLSTSDVFRQKFSDAQMQEQVAFLSTSDGRRSFSFRPLLQLPTADRI